MNRYDYCHNSVTLDDAQKQFANETIWRKADQVTALFDQHGVQGNLYTGGSLAIRQPAVEIHQGRTVGLKSDLDLFLIVKELALTPAQKSFLEAVSKLDDDIEVSVHVQPAVRVREQLFSGTIDDLGQALDRPLRQTFELPPRLAAASFHPKTMAIYSVNRLAMSAAPFYVATHAYANLPGDKIVSDNSTDVKTATVILRLLTYGRVPGRLNISDLPQSARDGLYQGLLDEEQILDLVRRREQYDPLERPVPIEVNHLFESVARRDLALPAEATSARVCAAFVHEYLSDESARDSLHAFSLYLTRWCCQPDSDLRDLALAERSSGRFPLALIEPDCLRDLDALLAAQSPDPGLVASTMSPLVNANMRAQTESIRRKLLGWYAEEHAS